MFAHLIPKLWVTTLHAFRRSATRSDFPYLRTEAELFQRLRLCTSSIVRRRCHVSAVAPLRRSAYSVSRYSRLSRPRVSSARSKRRWRSRMVDLWDGVSRSCICARSRRSTSATHARSTTTVSLYSPVFDALVVSAGWSVIRAWGGPGVALAQYTATSSSAVPRVASNSDEPKSRQRLGADSHLSRPSGMPPPKPTHRSFPRGRATGSRQGSVTCQPPEPHEGAEGDHRPVVDTSGQATREPPSEPPPSEQR